MSAIEIVPLPDGQPVEVDGVVVVATAPRDDAPIATPTTTRAVTTAMTTGARRPESKAWLRTILLTKSLLCDEAGSCAGARRLNDPGLGNPPACEPIPGSRRRVNARRQRDHGPSARASSQRGEGRRGALQKLCRSAASASAWREPPRAARDAAT